MSRVAEIRGTHREHPHAHGGSRRPRRLATVVTRIRDAALALAGLAGLAAIAWGIATLFFGFSLVTFATGSMAPTIPTGSLALVREVPASELEVGQVVTLQRGGERLPITHRIIAIEPDPNVPTGRIVSMQGDANTIPDLFPYHVKTGKVILGSVAGGQAVSDAIGSPITLVAVTLGAGALVLWAFWPRTQTFRTTEPQRGERRHARSTRIRQTSSRDSARHGLRRTAHGGGHRARLSPGIRGSHSAG
ncbi:S26 family signal peptidase [Clavibacter michiganensis]|nr:S26 family signal peptidase [Clavibacter michiganensis]